MARPVAVRDFAVKVPELLMAHANQLHSTVSEYPSRPYIERLALLGIGSARSRSYRIPHPWGMISAGSSFDQDMQGVVGEVVGPVLGIGH